MENIRERIVSCAGRVWFCAKELLKWLVLAMITGVPCGIIGAAFDLAVEHVTELRTEHTAILFLLPVIGLVIVAFYKAAKLEGVSTDDMIDCVKDGKPIRFWLLPVMFISTVLTHLGGGSAGREGAALQMGGTIGWWAGGVLHLNEHERRMAVQCGMAAFFSALFSTPLAATFFAMTIVNVGVVFYAAYIPCFTAAIIAYGVAQLIGVTPTRFAVEAPAFEPAMVVRVVLLALACAVVVHLFCFVLHSAAHGLPKLLPNPWVRAFLGGCVVVVFTLLYGRHHRLQRRGRDGHRGRHRRRGRSLRLPFKDAVHRTDPGRRLQGRRDRADLLHRRDVRLCGRAAAGHPGGLWRSPWVGWRVLRCQQLRGGVTGAGNRAVRCAGALVLCHRVRHYLCAFRLCRALPQPAVPDG